MRELKRHVKKLQSESAACVIRGVLRSDAPDPLRRRRTHFKDQATNWVMLDLDKVRTPKHLRGDYTSEHAAYVASLLPDEFQGVACVWQASASAGIDPKRLKLHLWFMLDRQLTAAQLRIWLKDCKIIDPSTLRCVQPHYTAAPVGSPYVGPRVGLLKGAIKRVPVPAELATVEESTSSIAVPERAEGTADVSAEQIVSARKKAWKRAQELLDNWSVPYQEAYTVGTILGPWLALKTWNDREHGHEVWKAEANGQAASWAELYAALPGAHGVDVYDKRLHEGIEWAVARERERLNTRSQAVVDRQLLLTSALRERLLRQLITHAGSEAKLREIGKQLGRYTKHMSEEQRASIVEVMQANSGFSSGQVDDALTAGEASAPDQVEAWRDGLVMTGKHADEILACDSNLSRIYAQYPGFLDSFRRNVRTKQLEVRGDNALGLTAGVVNENNIARILVDWFASIGCTKLSLTTAYASFKAATESFQEYDPFLEAFPEALLSKKQARKQLAKLEPKLDTWLVKHFGCKDTQYVRLVASKTLISAVARAVLPGCKVDTMLILQGKQGLGKSHAVRTLASVILQGYQELTDMKDKDHIIIMNEGLLVEMSELRATKYAQEEMVKAFFSRQRDRLRRPWGKAAEDFDRRIVFVGTTNDEEFLTDLENRRYWPVACIERCLMTHDEAVELWREAALRFAAGESWWMQGDEEELQRLAASEYQALDMYVEKLRPWVKGKRKVTLVDACNAVHEDVTQAIRAGYRVSTALRALGGRPKKDRRGLRSWVFEG